MMPGAAGAPTGNGDRERQTQPDPDRGRSVAEWASLAVSLLLLAGFLGLLTYAHFRGTDRPPLIDVQLRFDQAYEGPGGHYLPVEITNRGDATAGSVRVRLTLAPPPGGTESQDLVLDFLPGGATQRGTAVFRQRPASDNLSSTVSFLEP